MSGGGAGSSSASGYPAQRVGKRIRRKPQWLDGDRLEGTTAGGRSRSNTNATNSNSNNNNSSSRAYDDGGASGQGQGHHQAHNARGSKGGKDSSATTSRGGGSNMNMSMVASSTTAAPNGLGMSGPGVPGGTTGTAGMGSMAQMNDTDSTVSLKSTDSSGEAPVIDDPVFEMWRAVTTCQDQQSNRRDIVDAFHSWQKSAVSKQAAQQKALHVYLKRRLRKRTTRLPEVDRSEEEALRNARRGLDDDEEEDNNKNNKNKNKNNANGGSVGGDDKVNNEQRQAATRRKTNELIEENSLHGNTLVPSKVRLPLEAYLPRRVRPARDKPTVDDLWSIVPDPPRLPTALKSQGKSWLTLPTVNPSSEWNSRKSSTTAGTVATATMATATMAAIVGHKRPLDGGDGGLPHENEHDDH